MLFSIIVPIYNVEKYIKNCIESVLTQSCADFELILVDDGSPDGCPAICDEFAKSDARIKVIHKQNGGLVSARQAGIKVAQGEYIINLDGDDALCPDALASAQKIIAETNADIISFAHKRLLNGEISEVQTDLIPEGFFNKEQIKEHIYPKLLSDKNMEHFFYFLWGRAFKKELILPHQLAVNPAISLGEDLSCIVPCFLDANTVFVSNFPFYLYTIRNDSISTDFKTQQITQIQDVILSLKKIENNKPVDFEEQISRYSCFMCFAILAAAAEGNHFNSLKKITELINSSIHKEEIKKARFERLSAKSRIAIFLMQKNALGLAFYFLYICKELKRIRKSDKK
ncbi:MAG: glycosyltransferase family 2 protein [Clostridia bacterium]|nr:glycosyltransferase family 2 protein [Clostridia bacterium]